ncbi:MAG TPA: transposase [Oceanospirillales bacterium]|nr:transposase [Oceanospirillales bacterium]
MNNKNRQSIRLQHYDYSQCGLYFITICTHKKLCLFGEINKDKMFANNAGFMIASCWMDLSKRFNNIQLHEYLVMPNHFHGIIEIFNQDKGLGAMIGAFKSITTNKYIKAVKEHKWLAFDYKLWQRNYYEHIIRNEQSHQTISEYIKYNPAKWSDDKYYNP